MDPLAIAAGVASLVVTTTKVVKQCNDFHGQFKIASITLPAISTECQTICAALSQIEDLFDRNLSGIVEKLQRREHLLGVFDNALTGCAIVVSIIDDELKKLIVGDGAPGKMVRLKYMWNEGKMQELLQQARGQQTAIQTLLAVIQAESIFKVQDLLQKQGHMLERVARRAYSLRETITDDSASTLTVRTTDSVSLLHTPGSEKRFSFDSELANSEAYKRTHQGLSIRAKKETRRKPVPSASPTIRSDDTLQNDGSDDGKKIMDRVSSSVQWPEDLRSLFEVQITAPSSPRIEAVTPNDDTPSKVSGISIVASQAPYEKKLKTSAHPYVPRTSNILTLLHIAASSEGVDIISLFLSHDLDPNIVWREWTPLNIAIEKQNYPAVKLLLDAGADVELVAPDYKWYPLYTACQAGDVRILKLLLEHGAKTNVVTSRGGTPLFTAAMNGYSIAVNHLLQHGADPDFQMAGEKMCALHTAAAKNHLEIIKSLLQSSATIDLQSTQFGTPLAFATTKGNIEACRILLKAGANVHTVDSKSGQTPLHSSIRNGHKAISELLLDFGADPDALDAKGIPAWHRAIHAGRADILDITIQKMRLRGPKDFLEKEYTRLRITSLQFAAVHGRPEVISLLLKYGADPTRTTHQGGTLLGLADQIIGDTKDECVRILEEAIRKWGKGSREG